MRLLSKTVLFAFIACSIDVTQVYSCVVSPMSAATVTGNSTSVVCTPDNGTIVTAWRRDESHSAQQIYQRAFKESNIPKYVADGYSVDDTNSSSVTLTVNSANASYVGYYWCYCVNGKMSNTYISVLDSEPTFNASDSFTIEDPVMLNCSLSVAGIVYSTIKIINSSGNVLQSNDAYISSNISKPHSLSYNVSQFSETIYYCNISLRNSTDDSSAVTVFTRRLNITMHLSVHNTSIYSDDPNACEDGGFCKKGVTIRCKLDGLSSSNNQWILYFNGNVSTLDAKDSYSTQYVGPQIIQCNASKRIGNTFYYGSANFTTNVTDDEYVPPSSSSVSDDSKKSLIIGLVVGLGGGLLLILIIIVAVILWKRQKRRTACCNLEQPKDPQVQERNEERKQYAQVTKKGSSQPGTNSYAKSNGSSETVLVENHLYSGTNNRDGTYNTSIDPSDGGIQEGGYSALDEFSVKEKS